MSLEFKEGTILGNKKRIVAHVLAVAMAFSTVFAISAPKDVYAAEKTVVVSTQKKLDAALKDSKVTKITIKSSAKKSFTIKKGSYGKKALVVEGAKITVTNAGKFKSISVKDAIKYTEAAKDNAVKVTDKKLSLVVKKGASVKSINLAKTGAKDSIVVNGTLKSLKISKKSDVTLKGDTSKSVPVTVSAKDSKITSQIKVNVSAAVDTSVTLGAGAEGSKIVCTTDGITLDVTNDSGKSVFITDKNGNKTEVKAGESLNKDDSGNSEGDNDKKDDAAQDDKKPAAGGGGSSSGGGSWDSGSSTISGSEFATVIANASYNDAQAAYIVNLEKNVSGDVNAIFSHAGKMIINLGNHTVSGSFKIEAPSATFIYFNDNGVGANGATVTGDFEVKAPAAHVENRVSINGTTKIHEVSNSTYCMFDKSAKFEVYGAGKIQFAENVVNPPKIDVKTDAPIILAGAIDKVEVQADAAKIDIAGDTAIGEVIIPEGKADTVISGTGKIETVNASAPVTVQAVVDNVVVNNDTAEITVSGTASIANVTVTSNVTNVKVSGNVAAIDVSNAGNDIVISGDASTKIVVKDADQAAAIINNQANASVKDSVVYVTGISVIPKSESDSNVTLAVGEELNLNNYTISVTYNKGTPEELAVTRSMLKNPDYVLATAGTAEVRVAYAGQEALLATITYLDKDIVTLASTVGQKEIKVNGDGYYFDAYTIGVECFDNNGLATVLKATSKYGMDIQFQHKILDENGQYAWQSGLPADAGDYVIRAYTAGNEQYFGNEAIIWIFSSAGKDFFEFDRSKIPAEIAANISVSDIQVNYPIDNMPVELASIRFNNDSYSTDALRSLLDSAVSTHNKAQITYKYFAQGAVFGDCSREGLPSIPGGYCIELIGIDKWNNQSYARIYVNCSNQKFAVVNAAISGNGITVASATEDVGDINYIRSNSTIEKTSDDTVSVELRNGCINQFDIIEIPQGTDYKITICSGEKSIAISDCRIINVKEFVVSNNTWHETGSRYEGQGWPTEKGRYRIAVCVEEDAVKGICETWSSFVIIIK